MSERIRKEQGKKLSAQPATNAAPLPPIRSPDEMVTRVVVGLVVLLVAGLAVTHFLVRPGGRGPAVPPSFSPDALDFAARRGERLGFLVEVRGPVASIEPQGVEGRPPVWVTLAEPSGGRVTAVLDRMPKARVGDRATFRGTFRSGPTGAILADARQVE